MRIRMLAACVAAAGVVACSKQAQSPVSPDAISVPVRFEASQGGGGEKKIQHFGTHATGSEEVPPNASPAQGQAIFQLSRDGQSMRYKVAVANIENVTQSHIHLAAAGVNGPIVVWLYPSAPPLQLIPGPFQGVLGEGVITANSLVGPLAGATLQDLLDEMVAGRTYVNVHTTQFPPGEIRGQVR